MGNFFVEFAHNLIGVVGLVLGAAFVVVGSICVIAVVAVTAGGIPAMGASLFLFCVGVALVKTLVERL